MGKVVQGITSDAVDPSSIASVGPVGGLSTSDTARIHAAYPDSVSKGGSSIIPGTGVEISLEKSGYREFYNNNVLRFDGFSHEVGEVVSLSYDGAPDLQNLNGPEDEKPPGKDGSTIVAAGIGPNVNVQNLNKDKKLVMVDPTFVDNLGIRMSLPPFVGDGSESPKTTASKITSAKLGDYLPGISTRGSN